MTPLVFAIAQQLYPAATYAIPASLIPAGYTVAVLMLTIAAPDFGNVATVVSAGCEFSTDGGTTWVFGGSFGFQGGGTQGANIGPGITICREALAGQRIRASITLNRLMTVGGTLTLT